MCWTANLIEEKGKHFAWQIFRWNLSFLLLKADSLLLLWTAGSYAKMIKYNRINLDHSNYRRTSLGFDFTIYLLLWRTFEVQASKHHKICICQVHLHGSKNNKVDGLWSYVLREVFKVPEQRAIQWLVSHPTARTAFIVFEAKRCRSI